MGVGVGGGVGAGGVGAGAGAGDGVVGASDEDSQPMATSEKTRHPATAKRRIMRTATSSRRDKRLSLERGPARVNWNRAGTRDGRNYPGVSAEGSRSICPVPPG